MPRHEPSPCTFRITGQVSVEACQHIKEGQTWCILILGPTGAGKSSFVEALAGESQCLGISKDQLDGFTQKVTAYEVKNAMVEENNGNMMPLYLIDAPGFSDSKLSELEILTKVKQWMSDQDTDLIQGVLYLTPVTDTRLPGSKRRTIKMIRMLLWEAGISNLNIVTTMWDRVSSPQAEQRAEVHFAQLRDDIWKGPIDEGAQITKFYNNHDSALQIMRHIFESGSYYPALLDVRISPKDRSGPFLYQELLDRISNAQQEKEYLRHEKIQLISKPDPTLELDVLSRLSDVNHGLAKFLHQLVALGTPSEGFEGVAGQVVFHYLLGCVEDAELQALANFGDVIKATLEELGAFSDQRDRAQFLCACWPHLHTDIKNILFDQLVQRIRMREEGEQHHRLDRFRQAITELGPGVNYALTNLKQDVMAVQTKQLTAFYPPPPEFDKVRSQLYYECLLCEVNCYKGAIPIIQGALDKLHNQLSHHEQWYKDRLKDSLVEAKRAYATSALALIEYGNPPEGYERIVFNYHNLSNTGRIAQIKRDAKALFGKKH